MHAFAPGVEGIDHEDFGLGQGLSRPGEEPVVGTGFQHDTARAGQGPDGVYHLRRRPGGPVAEFARRPMDPTQLRLALVYVQTHVSRFRSDPFMVVVLSKNPFAMTGE